MKTLQKFTAITLTAALALSLAACDSASAAQNSASEAQKITVGILQYAPHPSLENCSNGFKLGLAESGFTEGGNITFDFQNAQGDPATADLLAKNMAAKKYALICGVATPAAMSAYAASREAGIPVVFTAVSDPLAAGIVKSLDAPGVNCTGSRDLLPLEEQIKMIRAFLPEAKKIGILYTTSEENSVSQLKDFQELAPKHGFTVEAVGVTNAAEVASGAATLVAKGVDCLNNFTDNNVVNNLSTVLKAADNAGIPVFGSEVEQVKNGCLASQSIDYVALGKETGKMAAQILKGEKKAESLPVFTVKDFVPVYSQAVLDKFNLKLPSDYADAEAVSAS